VRAWFNMFGRLGPTFMELNFFSSSSSVVTMEKDGWSGTRVMVYKTKDQIAAKTSGG